MRKRLTMALAAGALVAAMAPGVASAAQDQTNLGQCVAEANQALKGTGIKLKVGQFDDIVLGTNEDRYFNDPLPNPDGPTLICGFGGRDRVNTVDADDVFVGGAGGDSVGDNFGIYLGGDGDDGVDAMKRDSFFDGGPGFDSVLADAGPGATCRYVEGFLGSPPCTDVTP